MNLPQIIKDTLSSLTYDQIVVAYSGGVDSTALLLACAAIAHELSEHKLVAVHVNHGLSSNAEHWEKHCKVICEGLGVEFRAHRVTLDLNAAMSLEEQARDARYRVFGAECGPDDLLLLAHHQDDQVETILQRLLRGSGPGGLRGMQAVTRRDRLTLVRPFLEVSRAEIERWVVEQHCAWVEDESNARVDFDRNFLRLQVIPLLQSRWPEMGKTFTRSARLCGETADLLDSYVHAELGLHKDSNGNLLCATLTHIPKTKLQQLIRCWLSERNVQCPSEKNLLRVIHEVILARTDAHPEVRWGEWSVSRYKGSLHVYPVLPELDLRWEQTLSLTQTENSILFPLAHSNGFLRVTSGVGAGLAARFWGEPIVLRLKQGGESCKPAGRSTRSLKKCLQESTLPRWWRSRQPILYVGDALAALPGLFVCEGFQALPGEPGLVLEWLPPQAGSEPQR